MKSKSNALQIPFLVAAVLSLAALPLAHAVPTLRLTDGVNTVTIADAGGGDLNPSAGAVTFIGTLGNFSLNVSTGISKPYIGSQTLPYLELNSVDISGLAGTLTILFSDDSFGPTSSNVTARIGGVTYGTVSYTTYADASNALFGKSTLLTAQGPFGGAFSGTTYGALAFPSTFSLTQKVVITHAGYGVSSFDAEFNAVPDGGSTLALFGAVLVGLQGFRRKPRGAVQDCVSVI